MTKTNKKKTKKKTPAHNHKQKKNMGLCETRVDQGIKKQVNEQDLWGLRPDCIVTFVSSEREKGSSLV